MKRILLLFAILMCSNALCDAQDIIITKKGEEIQAKILEVSPRTVTFKRFNNPDGPNFVLNTSDIIMVRYENGDKDIFDDTPAVSYAVDEVYEGMRYGDYKDLYNTAFYVPDEYDPYSPFWSGVASFFIPGLGQCVSGEWQRGLWIFGSSLLLEAALLSSVEIADLSTYNVRFVSDAGTLLAIASSVGLAVLDIWNICDAVHVAKVKNMYVRDIRSQRASLDMKLEPFLTYSAVTAAGYQPAAGFSLKLTF
ncbi:MAG: hypothetical protein J6P67_09790 [Bacteroidaceae bacterium]|nr:hypothetical protein [Bacteroidaceae bacterium]